MSGTSNLRDEISITHGIGVNRTLGWRIIVTYIFPPLEWYEPGTTSGLVVTIVFFSFAVALPISIIACWRRPPRWRVTWVLLPLFWLICPFIAFGTAQKVNAPPDIVVPALLSLIVLPVVAMLGVWLEYSASRGITRGFHDPRNWCLYAFVAFILVMCLLPPNGHSREADRRTACRYHLKTLGYAIYNYHDRHKQYPFSETQPARSWRVELLPLLDHLPEYNAYDQNQPWNSPQNARLASVAIREYLCPSAVVHGSSSGLYTSYALLDGPQTAAAWMRRTNKENLPDGTSNTALLVEACGQQIVWTEPRNIVVAPNNIGINLPGTRPHQSAGVWSSYHKRKGGHTMYVDGSVRFLSADTDPSVLRAITTADGGEPVPGDFW